MKKVIIGILVAGAIFIGACQPESDENNKRGGEAASAEQESISVGTSRLVKSQPVPVFDYSQHRQTLADVETIQATGASTTSSFYLEGIGLIEWCPSIGLPIPSTAELSNGVQWVDIPDDESRELYQIEQMEPTGIYTGESSGTYTICLDDQGRKFAYYWEGYVNAVSGIRTPDAPRVTISDITFEFTEEGDK